ncbi:MAG: DmsE family decaheme c-type cytochrome [Halioglobus sp.]|nr:DmsE family decaheme c-type cytochrome [Halioglobus sp.]
MKKTISTALLACCTLLATLSMAEEAPGCLDCHPAEAGSPTHSLMNSIHGAIAGGGAASCVACHGPSEAHDRRGRREAPDVSFGPKWVSDLDVRNGACIACHDNGTQLLWSGSEHEQENLACADCHNSHQVQDPAMDKVAGQQMCLDCHASQRAQLRLPSRHPIAEGKTACTDCHNPHGSAGEAALHQLSINDNCYSCHEDKRGPFLWEHEPVAEDCSLCHRSHGSVHDRLLVTRGPASCQQCHSAAFHPSVPYGGDSLSGGRSQNVLGKNCLNCHSQIHGSNHPSGARLTR